MDSDHTSSFIGDTVVISFPTNDTPKIDYLSGYSSGIFGFAIFCGIQSCPAPASTDTPFCTFNNTQLTCNQIPAIGYTGAHSIKGLFKIENLNNLGSIQTISEQRGKEINSIGTFVESHTILNGANFPPFCFIKDRDQTEGKLILGNGLKIKSGDSASVHNVQKQTGSVTRYETPYFSGGLDSPVDSTIFADFFAYDTVRKYDRDILWENTKNLKVTDDGKFLESIFKESEQTIKLIEYRFNTETAGIAKLRTLNGIINYTGNLVDNSLSGVYTLDWIIK